MWVADCGAKFQERSGKTEHDDRRWTLDHNHACKSWPRLSLTIGWQETYLGVRDRTLSLGLSPVLRRINLRFSLVRRDNANYGFVSFRGPVLIAILCHSRVGTVSSSMGSLTRTVVQPRRL